MGATVRFSKGADVDYYLRKLEREMARQAREAAAEGPQAGKEAAAGGPGRAGMGYYLGATAAGGEPDGHWIREGLADVGIHDGEVVDPDVIRKIYGEFVNPLTGEHLGVPPRVNAELRKLFAEKVAAAGPGLTRAQEHALFVEARAEVKSTGTMYYDGVFSVDKTITLAAATALAAAAEARANGDAELAARWDDRAAGIWEEIRAAERVYVDYVQSHAKHVRVGHFGKRVDGVDQGRFEDAHDIPVAAFEQHTNENGDPHLHIHTLWLNKVKSASDGKWRGVDERALRKSRGAASAVAAATLESRLAERFGFRWVYREASKGRVIEGFTDKDINAYSSRHTTIKATVAGMIAAYEAEHGRPPTQRQVYLMNRHAWKETRGGAAAAQAKAKVEPDYAQLLRDWERTAAAQELGTLAEMRDRCWDRATGAPVTVTPEAERRVMAEALALAQSEAPAWDRRTLVAAIGRVLPDNLIIGGDAGPVFEALADRIMAGETGEDVYCLTAPEWPRVPGWLRRADGESVYRAPGAEVYATGAQLSAEEQMIARAQAAGAPHLAPDVCAKLLGSTEEALEAQLHAATVAAAGERTGSGLRLDQAAAGQNALTSDRRAEIIIAAAGTGKTTTAGQLARAWTAAGMGRVYGVTLSSAARNQLAAADPSIIGKNLAQMLGHLPGRREALGTVSVGENTLIIVDEATMASGPDAGALLRVAERENAKLLLIGDIYQLAAVEQGGAMEMLARKCGYAQLQEPVRFAEQWQRDASVQLREGDTQALVAYDARGALRAGEYEDMAEAAVRAYLRDFCAGKDALMTARTNAETRDLSRRAQDYLQHWGMVSTEGAARLREGAKAHEGDLILARKNDGDLLLNSDLLKVEQVTGDAVTVRKSGGWEDGQRRWSDPFTVTAGYLQSHCDLGYAATWMCAQGSSVGSCQDLVSSLSDRNGLYESMTRGREQNTAWMYELDTGCEHGTAAPEIERYRKLEAERTGGQPWEPAASDADPVRIAAGILGRQDEILSATETRQRSMANADHLGLLWGQWQDLTREVSGARYTAAVREQLPAELAGKALADTDDLFRALRAAELTGLPGEQALAEAIGRRDLAGADSIAAVLAHRIRSTAEARPPLRFGSFAERAPVTGDPETDRYAAALATAMDERQARIGDHAAGHPPAWATGAFGPVPEDPQERDKWAASAGLVGAYRERYGITSDRLPLGPEPGTTSPEARAEWRNAFPAITHAGGDELDSKTDGQLLTWLTAAERALAAQPVNVTAELQAARKFHADTRTAADVAARNARAAWLAGKDAWARINSGTAADMADRAARCETVLSQLETIQDGYDAWEATETPTLDRGTVARTALQRRGVAAGYGVPPAPEPLTGPEPGGEDQVAEEKTADTEARMLRQLGISEASAEAAARIARAAERNAAAKAKAEEIRSAQMPDEDPDLSPFAAWDHDAEMERGAILQPAPPAMPASPRVPEPQLFRQAGADHEAGS
jgi:AAA domain/TrwC relaxase